MGVPDAKETPPDPATRFRGGMRAWLLLGLGHVCVAIGVVGIFLPLLPTTPFLLLAAGLYAKGSPRFEAWLLTHPRLGPPVRDWREGGVIGMRAKATALTMIALSAAFTLTRERIPTVAKASAAVVLGGAALFIATRPSLRKPNA